MGKKLILICWGIMFLFTFSTIWVEVARLSGKNYKEENRCELRHLTLSGIMTIVMYIGITVFIGYMM